MSIEIPGEPTLRRAWVPPEQISLPIAANPRIGFLGGYLILAGLTVGPLMLAGGVMVELGAPSMAAFPSVGGAIMSVIGLFMTAVGWCVVASAATLVADRFRRRPVLMINVEAIQDTRLVSQPIPWTSIVRASVYSQSPYAWQRPATGIPYNAVAVCLELRTTIAARHNPFRLGALGFRWRRRSNELYVPLYCLTRQRDVLAHVVAALVRQHGGIVEPAEQTRGEWRRLLRFLLSLFLGALVVYVLIGLGVIILLALVGLLIASKLLAPLARRRGWFSEGRLNARLNRPRFEDDTHRTTMK